MDINTTHQYSLSVLLASAASGLGERFSMIEAQARKNIADMENVHESLKGENTFSGLVNSEHLCNDYLISEAPCSVARMDADLNLLHETEVCFLFYRIGMIKGCINAYSTYGDHFKIIEHIIEMLYLGLKAQMSNRRSDLCKSVLAEMKDCLSMIETFKSSQ